MYIQRKPAFAKDIDFVFVVTSTFRYNAFRLHFPITKTVGHGKCSFVHVIERAVKREREKPAYLL